MNERSVSGAAGDLALIDHGGDGPDVVLLHGANRNMLDWAPVIAELHGRRCVAYDLRGHGRSAVPDDGSYDWDAHISDLETVIEALDLQDPVVVGHSLGGDIACVYGERHPECRGIVDLDGFGGGHARQYPGHAAAAVHAWRSAQTEALTTMLEPAVLSDSEADVVVGSARAAAPSLGVSADFEEAVARRSLVRTADGKHERRPLPRAQESISAPLEDWDVFEVLGTLRCPALAVHGTRRPAQLDAMPSPARELLTALMDSIAVDLEAIAEANPRIEVALLPDAAHMVHLEATPDVGRLIQRFIGASTD